MTIDSVERFVPFPGAADLVSDRRRSGGSEGWPLPLLLLHGGPGVPREEFEPLEVLARSGRPVVRYDVGGWLRGAFSGRARLTFLDLDYVGADDSYLCDTGTRRYRASR